ncbi:hypothetical protein [Methanosphaera sp.]|jgi:hypothetical protein|nr:hypothetical protein [Methanobacteriaceae archaeon]
MRKVNNTKIEYDGISTTNKNVLVHDMKEINDFILDKNIEEWIHTISK